MKYEEISDDLRDAFEERAAIIHDGCGIDVTRKQSEMMAAESMGLDYAEVAADTKKIQGI
ncbi:hypothetical protein UFOVP935_53 [uncultured Caudovirales phage]|uniref:Uncharacterized protein n=1 Tax=uncultured Caudovirales phage TaxID=2100421 RepID=A0A6J5PN85_9CAUD|nr:hypothetical protein UFOVP935_53 [uncultured Caudovirales phage]